MSPVRCVSCRKDTVQLRGVTVEFLDKLYSLYPPVSDRIWDARNDGLCIKTYTESLTVNAMKRNLWTTGSSEGSSINCERQDELRQFATSV